MPFIHFGSANFFWLQLTLCIYMILCVCANVLFRRDICFDLCRWIKWSRQNCLQIHLNHFSFKVSVNWVKTIASSMFLKKKANLLFPDYFEWLFCERMHNFLVSFALLRAIFHRHFIYCTMEPRVAIISNPNIKYKNQWSQQKQHQQKSNHMMKNTSKRTI